MKLLYREVKFVEKYIKNNNIPTGEGRIALLYQFLLSYKDNEKKRKK